MHRIENGPRIYWFSVETPTRLRLERSAMQRNSDKCGHCGRMFVRADGTAVVNRSDGKTFHVSLISGPDPRPDVSGGFQKDQAVCKFGYVSYFFGPNRCFLDVFIKHADDGRQGILQQIEGAADKIAEMVHAGHELAAAYTLDGGLLAPGFPK